MAAASVCVCVLFLIIVIRFEGGSFVRPLEAFDLYGRLRAIILLYTEAHASIAEQDPLKY